MTESVPAGPLPGSRRRRILAFAAIATAIVIAVAWIASFTAPNSAAPTVGIADATNLQVAAGGANAVVFPFQLAPDTSSSEDSALSVTTASASVTVEVPACVEANASACPGVIVEVLTSGQVSQFASQTNLTPVWCTNATGGACSATTSGSFSMDLTAFAGAPLDLVVWSPAGVQWADVTAQGTWSS
ncbi:MAG TPA: hypothetical protein VN864_08860 [Thermoplasmata archaeon]|nr:hypothetical protein [Thermoplasmata archaeon]